MAQLALEEKGERASIELADDDNLDVFTGKRETVRGERYVFTGNLLKSFNIARGVVSRFKYRTGETVYGNVMRQGWRPQDMLHDPRYDLNTAEEILACRGYVYSRDGYLKIQVYGEGDATLKASGRGKKIYATNDTIVAITGNWRNGSVYVDSKE